MVATAPLDTCQTNAHRDENVVPTRLGVKCVRQKSGWTDLGRVRRQVLGSLLNVRQQRVHTAQHASTQPNRSATRVLQTRQLPTTWCPAEKDSSLHHSECEEQPPPHTHTPPLHNPTPAWHGTRGLLICPRTLDMDPINEAEDVVRIRGEGDDGSIGLAQQAQAWHAAQSVHDGVCSNGELPGTSDVPLATCTRVSHRGHVEAP
jgi:hypothetical protein